MLDNYFSVKKKYILLKDEILSYLSQLTNVPLYSNKGVVICQFWKNLKEYYGKLIKIQELDLVNNERNNIIYVLHSVYFFEKQGFYSCWTISKNKLYQSLESNSESESESESEAEVNNLSKP